MAPEKDKRVALNLSLPPALVERLKAEAQKKGTSVSRMLERPVGEGDAMRKTIVVVLLGC